MISLKKLFCCTFTVATLCFGIYAHAQEENKSIVVTNAWVRVMPPTQKNTAAYMTIENKTDKEMILKSASTDAAGEVQTHKMEHINGMMKMQQVEGVTVPAQGQVELKPHGFHLMLLNLTKPIKDGDAIAIVLKFEDDSTVTVNAVAKGDGMDREMMEHMNHHE